MPPAVGLYCRNLRRDFDPSLATSLARTPSRYSTSDTLGEVSWLVDVGALGNGGVIGQQLYRDRVEDRRHDRIDRPAG